MPSPAKQQLEVTKFCVVCGTRTTTAKSLVFPFGIDGCHYITEQQQISFDLSLFQAFSKLGHSAENSARKNKQSALLYFVAQLARCFPRYATLQLQEEAMLSYVISPNKSEGFFISILPISLFLLVLIRLTTALQQTIHHRGIFYETIS